MSFMNFKALCNSIDFDVNSVHDIVVDVSNWQCNGMTGTGKGYRYRKYDVSVDNGDDFLDEKTR